MTETACKDTKLLLKFIGYASLSNVNYCQARPSPQRRTMPAV